MLHFVLPVGGLAWNRQPVAHCNGSGRRAAGSCVSAVRGRTNHAASRPPSGGMPQSCRGAACRAAAGTSDSARTAQKEAQQQQALTGPLQLTTLEQLTSVERQPVPLWSTFCGVSGGCWQGIASAFSPYTGEPEPVALDDDGKPVYNLHTVLVDERRDDDHVERRIQHALEPEALRLRGAATASTDGVDWDVEQISADERGLVVFDGGSYSRGPLQLGAISQKPAHTPSGGNGASFHPALAQYDSGSDASNGSSSADESSEPGEEEPGDDAELQGADAAASQSGSTPAGSDAGHDRAAGREAEDGEGEEEDEGALVPAPADDSGPQPRQTVLIEQCMAWGGEQRVRFQIMLACEGLREGEELDVEVLRVGVMRESWQCLTDDSACSVNYAEAPPPDALPLSAAELAGDYKVFDLSAVSVEDTDPFTGKTQQQLLYFSQETAQRWGPPAERPDDEGVALWLPGGLLLQLRMVSPASRGREADASEGVDTSSPRGLLLSCGWGPSDGRGLLSLVEREYDGNGLLTEVRHRTAVRGGWVGGRM